MPNGKTFKKTEYSLPVQRKDILRLITTIRKCSFPLKKDKKGGGTEIDGSLSTKYCSMCYEKGEFLASN
jgi:hypothetical protein